MNRGDIEQAVLRSLKTIAPEVDLSILRGCEDLREALDIDSMDFLNFVIALHEQLQLEIPERDYPKLVTLNGCVEYLAVALAAKSQG